jgi:hypothetical protein
MVQTLYLLSLPVLRSSEFELGFHSELLTLNSKLIKRRIGHGKNSHMGNKDGCSLGSGKGRE